MEEAPGSSVLVLHQGLFKGTTSTIPRGQTGHGQWWKPQVQVSLSAGV